MLEIEARYLGSSSDHDMRKVIVSLFWRTSLTMFLMPLMASIAWAGSLGMIPEGAPNVVGLAI
jgi:hypothetical protein